MLLFHGDSPAGAVWQEQTEPAGGPSPEPTSSAVLQPLLDSISLLETRPGVELGVCVRLLPVQMVLKGGSSQSTKSHSSCGAGTRASVRSKARGHRGHSLRVVEQAGNAERRSRVQWRQ